MEDVSVDCPESDLERSEDGYYITPYSSPPSPSPPSPLSSSATFSTPTSSSYSSSTSTSPESEVVDLVSDEEEECTVIDDDVVDCSPEFVAKQKELFAFYQQSSGNHYYNY